MFISHYGEFAALLVAFFWTITALSFESAAMKVGSLPVNIIRLVFGFIFLSALTWVVRGNPLPTDASVDNWIWLSVSGLIGFVLGDLFLFKSYTIVGSWFAMLIMTLAPPLAAIFGWIILGETMSRLSLLGMFLTITGISIAIFSRKSKKEKFTINKPIKGIVFAFLGALGQGLGIVFSKLGMNDYDAFASTQIRIITGIIGFVIIVSLSRRWKSIFMAFKNTQGLKAITIGSFFGPFLGVSFSLIAIKHTSTGIASTIMAIVPILIIPPSILLFKHKITYREAIGAVIGVSGVVMFFI
jgi:drug/metabolite transporter (DMT)-like permease